MGNFQTKAEDWILDCIRNCPNLSKTNLPKEKWVKTWRGNSPEKKKKRTSNDWRSYNKMHISSNNHGNELWHNNMALHIYCADKNLKVWKYQILARCRETGTLNKFEHAYLAWTRIFYSYMCFIQEIININFKQCLYLEREDNANGKEYMMI